MPVAVVIVAMALNCWRSACSTCAALRLSVCAATGAAALDSSIETAVREMHSGVDKYRQFRHDNNHCINADSYD